VSETTVGWLGQQVPLKFMESRERRGAHEAVMRFNAVLASEDEYSLLEQQVGGLLDKGELWVPITVSAHPEWDGYYRVKDSSLSLGPGGLGVLYAPVTLEVDRFFPYSAPSVESDCEGVIRPAGGFLTLDASNVRYWHAVPGAAQGYVPSDVAGSPVTLTVKKHNGTTTTVVVHEDQASTPRTYTYKNYQPRFFLPPANALDGACGVRYGFTPFSDTSSQDLDVITDGWYFLQGRTGIGSSPHAYCLDNGRLRVLIGTEDPAVASVKQGIPIWVGLWNNSQTRWDWKLFRLHQVSSPPSSWTPLEGVMGPRTVWNRPETAALAVQFMDGYGYGYTLTLTLHRGASHVEVHVKAHTHVTRKWVLSIDTNTASSNLQIASTTVGLVATSVDGNGHKPWALMTTDSTNNLTTGTVTNDSDRRTFAGAIGLLEGGTVGTDVQNYFAAMGFRDRVVVV
jgi:hypothetical protein